MADIVIAEAVRSAVGRAHKGSLAQRRPDEFGAEVVRELLKRVPSVKPEMVEDLILGCAMPEGEQGLNVARIVGLLAGLPEETSAMTINRFCSSGLQAIALAAGQIALGYHDVIVAGGVESMSMVPMTGNKLSASPDAMEHVPTAYTPMGITAENVANRFEVSREDQDEFAFNSQQKAKNAIEQKVFQEEIVPVQGVRYRDGARELFEFNSDELPRLDTTREGLAKLRPVFAKDGSVTAGNASPLSDGAAAALVMSKSKAEELGVKPLAYFRHFSTAGVDPAIMGIGPIPAVRKLFAKTGLSWKDIDVVELNEAFASQSLRVVRELEIPEEKLNPNGGAIALGHPLGCTGAKLTATALYELKRRKAKRA
ncbi:MAG: thiolase family protein, partial [Myxococcota bacterium]